MRHVSTYHTGQHTMRKGHSGYVSVRHVLIRPPLPKCSTERGYPISPTGANRQTTTLYRNRYKPNFAAYFMHKPHLLKKKQSERYSPTDEALKPFLQKLSHSYSSRALAAQDAFNVQKNTKTYVPYPTDSKLSKVVCYQINHRTNSTYRLPLAAATTDPQR